MPTKRRNEARWVESRQHWRIDIQQNGDRRSFYSTIVSRKGKLEAEAQADEWLASGSGADMRFGTLWAAYLASIDRSESDSTYVKMEQLGRMWLLPRLENKRVSSINLKMMQDCVSAPYLEKSRSKRTCLNVRGALTAVYAYSKTIRVPMERPEGLKAPKAAPVGERAILQPNGLRTLFTVDTIRHYGKDKKAFYIYAWRFLVLSGLRRGEAAGLRREDIQGDVLYIRRAINSRQQETGGKNDNARRYIVLTDRMKAVLADQAAHLKNCGIITPWVFPSAESGEPDSSAIYKGWSTYSKQHGIPCSLHELRHTMISIVKADVPEVLLKQVVGHSASMDTHGVYGHEVDGEAQRASDLIAQAFNRLLD